MPTYVTHEIARFRTPVEQQKWESALSEINGEIVETIERDGDTVGVIVEK